MATSTRAGRWIDLVLVFLGGSVGTAARAALSAVIPALPIAGAAVPPATGLANVVGAFLLGLLLAGLMVRQPESPGRRRARLLLGTGLLGGFTTYSALTVETITLVSTAPAVAIAYPLGSVLLGLVAAWFGIAAGARIGRRSRTGWHGEPAPMPDSSDGHTG